MSGIPQSVFVFGECSCFINLWCSGYFTAAFIAEIPSASIIYMPAERLQTVLLSRLSVLPVALMLPSALLLALTTALSPSMVYCKPPATNVCANILGAIRERPIAAIRNFFCFMLVECWCKDKK